MKQISCRKGCKITPDEENPFPLVNLVVTSVEDEAPRLSEVEPVAPSLASDFDVLSNAMYRGAQGALYRANVDPVDFEETIANVMCE